MYRFSMLAWLLLAIVLLAAGSGLARSIGRESSRAALGPQAVEPQSYIPVILKPKPIPIPPTGVCAQEAPTIVNGAQAWTTQLDIVAGTTGTLCVRLIREDQNIAGASAIAVLHYPDREATLGPSLTANDGVATLLFQAPGSAARGVVQVDATVTYNDEFYSTTTCFNLVSGARITVISCG